jgi:Big-like domain-containing protein
MRGTMVLVVALAVLGAGWTAQEAAATPCPTPSPVEVRTGSGRTIDSACGSQMTITSNPSHGTLTGVPFSLGAQKRYTPDPGYTGPDAFSYYVDGGTYEHNVVTQQITVNTTANLTPVCHASPFSAVVREGTPESFTLTCTDDDGDPITLVGPTVAPQHGTVTIANQGAGTWQAQYAATSPGHDTVTFQGNDGRANGAAFSFDVDAQGSADNHAPSCQSYALEIGPYYGSGVSTFSCSDPDGDAMTLRIVAPAAHGTTTLSADRQSIQYEADDSFRGQDGFTYAASDGHGGESAPATISFTVRDPRPPYACHATTQGGVAADTDTQISLSCFPGDDGTPVVVSIDAAPAHGTLTPFGQAGSFMYHPQPGYSGPDSFTWHGTGPRGLSSGPQVVSFSVGGSGGVTSVPAGGGGGSGGADPGGSGSGAGAGGSSGGSSTASMKTAGLHLGGADAFFAPGAGDRAVAVSRGKATKLLVLRCAKACAVSVTTELTLGGASGRRASAAATRRVRLPVQRTTLKAGRQATVVLKLTSAAWQRLGQHRSATARIALAVRQGGKTVRDTTTFRVKLKR